MNFTNGVSATPTVEGDIVYFPTWGGPLVALNYQTCQIIWQTNATAYSENWKPLDQLQMKVVFSASRTSAIIEGDIVFFGTEYWALALALDKYTGKVIDSLQLNPHPYAEIMLSPTEYDGYQFWGVSSREESAARKISNYTCCSFVGNMVATRFDHSAGKFQLAWNQSTLPLDHVGPTGWAGASVWGSQPSIDVKRGQVFYGTGNVYRLPAEFEECRQQTANITVYNEGLTTSAPCLGKDVYQESVLALDYKTGVLNWFNQITPIDAWTGACGYGGSIQAPHKHQLASPNCPYKPGPDEDFGMAPTFVPGSQYTPYGKDMLIIGQKNGNMYGLDAQAGRILWATNVAPQGNIGGLSMGIAVDQERAYYVGINSDLKNYTLLDGNVIQYSAFGAVNINDGSLLWQTPAPSDSFAFMPPSVVNNVAMMGYTDKSTTGYDKSPGALVPVDASTGEVLAVYPLDAPLHGGVAIQDQYVMFGSGYHGYKGVGSFYVYKA